MCFKEYGWNRRTEIFRFCHSLDFTSMLYVYRQPFLLSYEPTGNRECTVQR